MLDIVFVVATVVLHRWVRLPTLSGRTR